MGELPRLCSLPQDVPQGRRGSGFQSTFPYFSHVALGIRDRLSHAWLVDDVCEGFPSCSNRVLFLNGDTVFVTPNPEAP